MWAIKGTIEIAGNVSAQHICFNTRAWYRMRGSTHLSWCCWDECIQYCGSFWSDQLSSLILNHLIIFNFLWSFSRYGIIYTLFLILTSTNIINHLIVSLLSFLFLSYFLFSLWSIMKNCIGKDLSKIPLPVNFSEPLSMLQRLGEEYEYRWELLCSV